MSSRAFNIAGFNTQDLRTENLKKVSIAKDAEKYNIQVLDLTETHIKENTKNKQDERRRTTQSITME